MGRVEHGGEDDFIMELVLTLEGVGVYDLHGDLWRDGALGVEREAAERNRSRPCSGAEEGEGVGAVAEGGVGKAVGRLGSNSKGGENNKSRKI